MAKKKGAIAAKARAKREARQGAAGEQASNGGAACVPSGLPLVHADGRRVRRGLLNLGNTCFMNSIAQCLNVSLPFSDTLIGLTDEGLSGIVGALCVVLRGIRGTEDTHVAGGGDKFSPKTLHQEVVSQFPWYMGKQQHDAHEFLRTLLGAISDELTAVERAAQEEAGAEARAPAQLDSAACGRCIAQSFRGHFCAASICWCCGQVSLRLDPFLDVSLDLPTSMGTSLGPLGLTRADQSGAEIVAAAEQAEEGEWQAAQAQQSDAALGSNAAAEAQLKGRWASKQDAVELEACREGSSMLVLRVVVRVLHKHATAELERLMEGGFLPSVQVEVSRVSRRSNPRWGFRWSESMLAQEAFVVNGLAEESLLDKHNLRCHATGNQEMAICIGDRLVEVNGAKTFQSQRERLKRDDVLKMWFVRGTRERTGSADHEESDEEEAAAIAELAASREAQRRHFCDQAARCLQALPDGLRKIFGNGQAAVKATNGHLELEDCWRHFSTVQALHDDCQPSYSCAVCVAAAREAAPAAVSGQRGGGIPRVQKTFASRRLWLWPGDLPPILTLQLKRFRQYSSEGLVKAQTRITLPPLLDLSDSVLSEAELKTLQAHAIPGCDLQDAPGDALPSGSSIRYELYAICEHQGLQMQGGHYIAYVNSGASLSSAEWFGISDAKVWKCTWADVLKAEAYVAFYRRYSGIELEKK